MGRIGTDIVPIKEVSLTNLTKNTLKQLIILLGIVVALLIGLRYSNLFASSSLTELGHVSKQSLLAMVSRGPLDEVIKLIGALGF